MFRMQQLVGQVSCCRYSCNLYMEAQGNLEKLSDEAVEETLEKVVKLLAYISDKDLFAEFYRKKLARRLLFDKSASDDHERSILQRLKQQCGAQFTSKVRFVWCNHYVISCCPLHLWRHILQIVEHHCAL